LSLLQLSVAEGIELVGRRKELRDLSANFV
jgi:hypothetical protein